MNEGDLIYFIRNYGELYYNPKKRHVYIENADSWNMQDKQHKERIGTSLYTNLGLRNSLRYSYGVYSVGQRDRILNNKFLCGVAPRDEIEQDNSKQQLVIGAVLTCNRKIILMECLSGEMEGCLTLPEGHVEYREGYENESFINIITQETEREMREEIKTDSIVHWNIPNIFGYSINNFDPKEPSYRHYGILVKRKFLSDPKLFTPLNIYSGEPDKNKLVILTYREALKTKKIDPWVKEILKYLVAKESA